MGHPGPVTALPDDTSPTSRALMALELIQAKPGITADQLGLRLGVSARAARRYVAILREAEVPVESVRGPYGGYRLGRGMRLPPMMFGPDEALGLVMAVLDGHHDVASEESPVGAALGKLVRALPAPVAEQVEAVRRSTATAPPLGAARPDLGVTSVLVRCCAERRRVSLDYRSESGRPWSVEMEPWAIVVRHERWYLLGHVPDLDALRALRVDRVREAVMLDQPVAVPEDLDPVRLLEEHLAVGWDFDTEVVIELGRDEAARYLPRVLGELTPIDVGRCRLVGTTSNPTWYAENLARLPCPFVVVGGPELRQSVATLAERLRASVADP